MQNRKSSKIGRFCAILAFAGGMALAVGMALAGSMALPGSTAFASTLSYGSGTPGLSGLSGLGDMPTGSGPAPAFKPYQRVHLGGHLQNSVIEVMVFECPFCRRLETEMLRWSATLPSSIHFSQMPATIGKRWVPMTQGFYAVALTDPAAIPRFNAAAFTLIQKQGYPFQSPRTYAMAAQQAGIQPGLYTAMLNNPDVHQLVYNDEKIMLATQITRTPTLIICGRYLINPGSTQGNYSMFFQLANGLISHCESVNKLKETP